MVSFARFYIVLLSAILHSSAARSFPHHQSEFEHRHNASVLASLSLIPRVVPGLKILCVGDSITVGVGDGNPDLKGLNNGYRLDLYNMLTSAGVDTQFIGTQVSGTNNPQPNMEGYGGQTINTILSNIQGNGIINQQPNLVLVHAGTNDNDLPQNSNDPSILYANAPYRLGSLLDYILCHDPNAVVIVAKLIQNNYNQAQTNAFNDQIPTVVGQRYMQGYKVRVVDMSMIGGQELSDALLHPNAGGYADMANRWYTAIQDIPASWWSTTGATSTSIGGPLLTCDRNAVSFTPAIDGNKVALGFHVNGDSPDPPSISESQGSTFSPGYRDGGVIAIGTGYPGSGVIFADLDGDGRPDYIWANYTAGSEGAIRAWLNGGPDVFNAVNNGDVIAFGNPGTSYVEFADLDGDKKAEYILVANGQFRIWQNGGPNGQVWNWNQLPNAQNELNYIFGNAVPFHWFADMNGDGHADLIIYGANGVLDMYLNNGADGNGGFSWTQCKAVGIATGSIFFADIDGDGKADYVSGDADGGLSGWINSYQGGCNIKWIPINGRTPKSLALGTGSPISTVRLADFTGDGKVDYLVVSDNGGAVHLYENLGSTHPPETSGIGGWGAAVRLNDMDGDGRDDYVSVTQYSGIAVYLNGGQGSGDTWNWIQQGSGQVIALGFPDATRHEVHLADMNADGRDDYLVVDDATGALHCYLNLGPSGNGAWNWNILGEIAIGVGGTGPGVRIADFNGDGRADYIYLNEDGSARVWLNNGQGNDLETWQIINGGAVAALGVGAARQDIYFADIDGDGKADFCWLHPDSGDLEVWYNLWDGHGVGWAHGGTLVSGSGYPGQNIKLGRIGTSGRWDYVAVSEDDGSLKAWYNECGNVIGTATRAIAGACGTAPMPTRSTSEPAPSQQVTEVSVNGAGRTVVQGSNGVQVTLPTGIASATTITTNGITFSYIPGGNTEGRTFTNSVGQTVIQDSMGAQVTLPPNMNSPTAVTQTDGQVQTFFPSGASPPPTAAATTTSSSSLIAGIIFPVSTSVPAPTASGTSQVIPCTLWFFSICIRWRDISIQGWEFNFPIGIRAPGPPPTLSIPGIDIRTIGPLPDWPAITVGPDHVPRFSPTSSPTNCRTETGQICLTATSVAVASDRTVTSVLSTCATVYGCEITDSESSTTTTTTAPTCALPASGYYSPYPSINFYTPPSTDATTTTSAYLPPATVSPGSPQLNVYHPADCGGDPYPYTPSEPGCLELNDRNGYLSIGLAGAMSGCAVQLFNGTTCADSDLMSYRGVPTSGACFSTPEQIKSFRFFGCY